MRLIIHRGAHEIGGNCVGVTTDSTRLILDAGMPLFGADRKPFDERLLQGRSVEELLRSGVLPNVPGLFANGPALDAILLSHAHMDHTGLLPFTRSQIPVYATTGTSKMMSAGAIFSGQVEIPRERYRKLIPAKPIKIGDLRVTAFSVDHSVYGSVAFLIEGQGKTVLYSGDLRLHGRKPGMTKKLLAGVRDVGVDLLLMEGTLLGDDSLSGLNEYELEKQITKHVNSSDGLVLASFSPQHVDRLVCFLRAAQRTRKTFVVDVYTAYVMHLIQSEVRIPSPTADNGIRVFYPQHDGNNSSIGDLFIANQITLNGILAAPETHLMVFRPSMFESDFGGELPERTCCVFSRWEGYLEQPEWKVMRDRLEAGGGNLLHLHTGGHCVVEDLGKLITKINPEKTIPIHTFEPEALGDVFENVVTMEDGQTVEV